MNTKLSQKRIRKNKGRSTLMRWGMPLLLIVGAVAIFALFQSTRQTVPSSPQFGGNVGDIAPDFSVPTLEGETFVLSESRGKPTIIFFMAYWCGNCIPEAQALSRLYQENQGQLNVIIIDIDSSSTPELVEQFKQAANGDALTWAFDLDFKVASSYQVNALDTTLILDEKGIIVYRDQVPTSYNTLKSALMEIGY